MLHVLMHSNKSCQNPRVHTYSPTMSIFDPPCVPAADKENTPSCCTADNFPKQRSETWFQERVGKVTSSKTPAVIGLYRRKEFTETLECIRNRKPEPSKNFKNFQRGIDFEESAAKCFSLNSGAKLSECGMFVLPSDNRFAASPDRVFQGETCSEVINLKTNKKVKLNGQCLLEIKTWTEGQSVEMMILSTYSSTCVLLHSTIIYLSLILC